MQPDPSLRKGFVFTLTGKKAIAAFSDCKLALDEIIADRLRMEADEAGVEYTPMPGWVFHDLRRTVATGLQQIGTPIEHTEALLNHISGVTGGLVGIYQRYKYWPEKVAAMAAWDRRIDEIRIRGRIRGAANLDDKAWPAVPAL
jgi:integrase